MSLGDTPAFPVSETVFDYKSFQPDYLGMTYRMWLAGLAMQGILCSKVYSKSSFQHIAELSVKQVDALIA